MPLKYGNAPCLVDNSGRTDCPLLLDHFKDVQRGTWVAKFASAFRTSRLPLAGVVGRELLRVYEQWRARHPEAIADSYVDALPRMPPKVETKTERRQKYGSNTRRC